MSKPPPGWLESTAPIGDLIYDGPIPPTAPPPEEADTWIRGDGPTWPQAPAEEAAKRLAEQPDVFLRENGASLVWLDDRGRPTVRPRMTDLDVPTLRGLIAKCRIVFATEVYNKKKREFDLRPVATPLPLCERIVTTRPGDDWRIISGIADAPYMLGDGAFVNTAGYRDGLWLCRNSTVAIPEDVTLQPSGWDATTSARAAAFILGELHQVDWQAPCDRSAAFAYLLTLFTRPAYQLAPVFLFTAPDSGSGKDLIAKCMESAVHGFEAVRINPPPGRTDDAAAEMDKKIGAAMKAGESTIVLGDIRQLMSPTIYGLTTEKRAQGFRVLGQSELIPVPRNLTLVGVGNNPEIGIDMVRRSVSIRITPRCQTPSERIFDKTETQLIEHYITERPYILGALANIVRGALHAPAPVMLPSPFSGWSRLVQASCIHAGLPDPLIGRETLKDRVSADDPKRLMSPFIAEWWRVFRDTRRRPSDLLLPLKVPDTEEMRPYCAALSEVHAAPSAAVLGKLLAAIEDGSFNVQDHDGTPQLVQLCRTAKNGSKLYWLAMSPG